MVIYSHKKQTPMNFLCKEAIQCHMKNDYIFPELKFRTCCYNGVSFQCKAEKIMDMLQKTEVYHLWWNTEVIC